MDCVSREEIQEMADEFSIEWFECSAKTGVNVEETFEHLASEITKAFESNIESLRRIDISQGSSKNKKKCC